MNFSFSDILDLLETVTTLGSMAGKTFSTIQLVVSIIVVIVGLLQCFFGYKLMRLGFAISGFVLGALVGAVVAIAVDSSSAGVAGIIILVCAILGAILLFRLYLLGVFLMDALLTFLLLLLVFGTDSTGLLILAAVLAIGVGVVGVKFVRITTIVTTAVSGGMLAGKNLAGSASPVLGLVFGLVFVVAGLFVQFRTTRDDAKRSSPAVRRPARPAPVKARPQPGAGAPVPPEARYAPTAVPPLRTPEAPAPQPRPRPGRKFCSACGSPVKPSDVFCKECGKKL